MSTNTEFNLLNLLDNYLNHHVIYIHVLLLIINCIIFMKKGKKVVKISNVEHINLKSNFFLSGNYVYNFKDVFVPHLYATESKRSI